MSETINRTPEMIASEILAIKVQSGKILLISAVEVGRRLAEAREIIPYGEFGKWLEDAVDYSEATAYRLIRIAEEYGPGLAAYTEESMSPAPFTKMGYTQAYVLLGIPAEERAEFIANLDIEKLSVSGLKQAVDDRNKAREEKAALQQELKAHKINIAGLIEERDNAKKEAAKNKQDFWGEQGKVTILQREIASVTDEGASIRRVKEMAYERDIARINQSMAQADARYELIVAGLNGLISAIDEMVAADPKACRLFLMQTNQLITELQQKLKKIEKKMLLSSPAALAVHEAAETSKVPEVPDIFETSESSEISDT